MGRRPRGRYCVESAAATDFWPRDYLHIGLFSNYNDRAMDHWAGAMTWTMLIVAPFPKRSTPGPGSIASSRRAGDSVWLSTRLGWSLYE